MEGLTDHGGIGVPENESPTASFTYTPQNPLVNQTITFNATSSQGNITNYTYNFFDGNTTTIQDPVITHSYAESGTYTVNLTVIDDEGLNDSTTKNVTVGCADLNSDGTVDMDDVYILLDHVGNHGDYKAIADVNCDGKVNMGDVILLLNHLNDPEKYEIGCCERFAGTHANIVITNVTPTNLAPGDSKEITLTVKNDGSRNARHITLNFQSSDYISVIGSSTEYIHSINAWCSKEVKITVHVAEDTSDGAYKLPINATFDEYYYTATTGYVTSSMGPTTLNILFDVE